eukprot:Platyproteum_vivax@DN7654_c0_g1_i15.p1
MSVNRSYKTFLACVLMCLILNQEYVVAQSQLENASESFLPVKNARLLDVTSVPVATGVPGVQNHKAGATDVVLSLAMRVIGSPAGTELTIKVAAPAGYKFGADCMTPQPTADAAKITISGTQYTVKNMPTAKAVNACVKGTADNLATLTLQDELAENGNDEMWYFKVKVSKTVMRSPDTNRWTVTYGTKTS